VNGQYLYYRFINQAPFSWIATANQAVKPRNLIALAFFLLVQRIENTEWSICFV